MPRHFWTKSSAASIPTTIDATSAAARDPRQQPRCAQAYVRPGQLERFFFSIIGISDALPLAPWDVIEQKRQLRSRVLWAQPFQIGKILGVERNDVCEPLEIRNTHLTRSIQGDLHTLPTGHGLRATVGWLVHVPVARSCRIDHNVEPRLPRLAPESGLGQR